MGSEQVRVQFAQRCFRYTHELLQEENISCGVLVYGMTSALHVRPAEHTVTLFQ